ncbi:LysR family transcriptional regulator [Streptomonospora sp. S1-112]|uniref:LysR family transcriptional regulator n=1 Tax=Streptomonospora mangrovi TaxID=2883123 RepID=A0A9X3NHU1_9ACTN|nr:LysR substrate-binding domain-containing protein [Streptomonospora mangrovi]MDA0563932.1 LysR family transcriptional regulator [Streptomonospora mangrovi]
MDIAHLRDFIAVIDSGSFTRAAARLFVSQPAVSQRMTQLESELGVRLVERGPRGVVPTPAGRALYRDAQHLVRQFDRITQDVASDRHTIQGAVAVGLPTTVAVYLAPALFTWTKRHYPGVHLQLFESMSGYIQELLHVGRLDLAVLFRADAAPRAGEAVLYAEELYLVGRRTGACPEPGVEAGGSAEETEAAGRAARAGGNGGSGGNAGGGAADTGGEVPLSALRGLPLVVPGRRSNLRDILDRAFADRGWTPTIAADVESLGTMTRIAESGEAWAVLPVSSVAALMRAPDLVVRRIVDPVLDRYVAVCTVSDYYEPRDAVSAVRHGIVEVTTALAAKGEWPGIRLTPPTRPE